MNNIEAFVLGIIQGLTEFLPISSSGHLEIGKALLNIQTKEDLTFAIVVHGATVLSTIVIFYKDIKSLLIDLLKFELNNSTIFILKIGLSMIPVGILGLLFKDQIEALFFGNVLLVGIMLIATGMLLTLSYYIKPLEKKLTYGKAFTIGLAQAIAVAPGISRSGATIATALILGINKETATKFSFLMVLVPIIGANLKDLLSGDFAQSDISMTALVIGFFAAFSSGLLACKWMIAIVKKGKIVYFAIYCLIAGLISIFTSL